MLLLLHGPGIINSRKQLSLIRAKFNPEAVIVKDDKFDQTNELLAPSLFSQPRLVILENPPETIDYSNLIVAEDLTLIFWFDKELTEKSKIVVFIKSRKGEIKFFDEKKEQSIFPFLDYLANRNQQAFVELSKLTEAELPYLLTMAYYLLRNLVNIPKNLPDFAKKKLAMQQQKFSNQELTQIYRELLTIDYEFKSGTLDDKQAKFNLVNSFMELVKDS